MLVMEFVMMEVMVSVMIELVMMEREHDKFTDKLILLETSRKSQLK